MSEQPEEKPEELAELDSRNMRAVLVLAILVAGLGAVFFLNRGVEDAPIPPGQETVWGVQPPPEQPELPPARASSQIRAWGQRDVTNFYEATRQFIFCWDDLPPQVRRTTVDTGDASNVHRNDYAGAKGCADCHQSNFDNWDNHPHSKMNALATAENVVGDFSGTQTINYLGGVGRFETVGKEYRMTLEKDGKSWVYRINRTIGSRYTQYYLGTLISGTVPDDAPRLTEDHVLPFGWWIKEQEWVPTVHVFREEDTDHEEEDPYGGLRFMYYDGNCAACHTTPSFAEWLTKLPSARRMTEYSPRPLFLHVAGLMHDSNPELFPRGTNFFAHTDGEMREVLSSAVESRQLELGVSCEACHHGSKEHQLNSTPDETKSPPSFSPLSPHLRWVADGKAELTDRTAANINLICARCHSGKRPMYANGAHTWNSTEYADAVRGFCYDPLRAKAEQKEHLTCITCHNPHKPTGYEWPLTERQNDQKCLECHQQYQPEDKLVAHTRHAADSSGSRCMNCHNPRIVEGLEKMIHTHRIFNPTDRDMIESNQPNACNLCHLEKPIDWTITKLREWYGEEHEYSEDKINANYPERRGPVLSGWLKSPHRGTRIAASSAATRESAVWAYPMLLDLLVSDDTLVNRQFTQRNLEERLGIDLKAKGYQFYMMPDERAQMIAKLRAEILAAATLQP